MIEIKTDDMGVKRGYKPRKPGGGRKKRKPLITAGVYESDVAEKVQDAFEKYRETQDYAWSAWQFFQVKDRKGNYRDIPGNWTQYAGYFPLWRLSYSIIPYIRMKFEQNRLGFQNLYNIPQGVEVPWLTYQQFSNLIGNVTDMVIAEQNWQPMIDTIWENRTVEDYETTSSTVKTDFMRKWHHNRSGKPISLDEMMESEDGDIFDVADPRGEFENSVISEMQIASFSESTITEKDREIRFVS